ncbi:hypothetical protein H6F75_20140 [Nodosilinea sp. FACHB-131]|uniref:hypothetical protein n=1 Tax=Cyanophyceae TaxID=3028117 RepID=UPI00168308B2|nr:hypothetical protein [Nodosilinea sp. FACHB-131]MBD1875798.1 hypothetical protein [Nodosilinea sp. FACHB-131]
MATRLWNFLTTDPDLASLEAADRAADAADAVLGLAKVLKEDSPNLRQVAALVSQLDSLLEAINAPLGKLMGAALPFVSISTGLLKIYGETTKKEPTLAQAVALMSQAAYLESLREFVKQHPKIEQWLIAKDSTPQARTITLPVKALSIFELTEQEARLATLHFHQSALAEAFNNALRARLVQLGTTFEQAERITKVVAKNTNRHLKTAIADAGDSLKHQLEGDRL